MHFPHLPDPSSYSGPWRPLPRSLALLAVASALGACGGGSTDVDASDPVAPPSTVPDVPTPSVPPTPDTDTAPPTRPAPPPPTPLQTACDRASGPVLQVGPGQRYAKPSAAAAAARTGDVIRIAAGDYRGDVATWKADRLTICGSGGRARLFADGRSASDKALWVVRGADTTIDSVEFHQVAVRDQNGAGIRAEHTRGDLHIINSGFYDNENGILTSSGPVTLTIERSEFARNGAANTAGQTHNIYVGAIDRVQVTGSFFHEARYGHNFKSRAKVSVLENNYLMDGPVGMSSYLADFPNGGEVVLRGNLFHKGAKSPNKVAIEYGAEGQRWPVNTLQMVHNTVVMTRRSSTFLRVMPWAQSLQLTANAWASEDKAALLSGKEFALASAVQQGNVALPASHFPGASSLATPRFWPDASGQAVLRLPGALDASYRSDSPAPYVLRALSGNTRYAGALQSPP